ncbi:MAG: Gfo/Idh/MocA family oxidoreductase [Acidimicrobiaceae bacterium]|nr:Gfo/Idh/MocA family oxidoreductase [Acidimicrobiaceae bacterium]
MAVRVGVVGTNFGAVVHAPAFLSEGAEVVLCGHDPSQLKAAAERLGVSESTLSFDALLADDTLDIVSIATPPALHAQMAISALEAGKHVLVEKPFAHDAPSAARMVDAARSSDRVAMVAHEFRYSSARRRTAELIAEGYIGSPRFALARFLTGVRRPTGPREYRPEDDSAADGAGLLFRIGSHYVDCFRFWLGEVVGVSGAVWTLEPDRVEAGVPVTADADDAYSFRLNFANGCFAEMFGTRDAPFGADFGITVVGSEGILLTPQEGVNPPPHGELLGARLGDDGLAPIPIPERLEPFADARDERMAPFRMLVRDLLRAIDEHGDSPAPNFDDGYRCQVVLDAIRHAAEEGRFVKVPS